MYKDVNDWLALGIFILVIGVGLSVYSVVSYLDIKDLAKKIDYELIDDNQELSNVEKYHKYIEFSEYLDQKLKKNKDIIIKNSSCVYLDYAQHNTVQLYRLANKMSGYDDSKQKVVAGKIRSLYSMTDNYKTCRKSVNYKSELKLLLDDIQKTNEINSQNRIRMDKFMSNYKSESKSENLSQSDDIIDVGEEDTVKQVQQSDVNSEHSVKLSTPETQIQTETP